MVDYRFFSILGRKSYYPPKDGMLTLLCHDRDSSPVDIAEANYLLPALDSPISSTKLIIRRAITLQKRREQLSALREKVYEARIQAADRFEKEHLHTIKQFDLRLGDLVLVRNTAIEKALNRKMRPRYLGPLIVISRNRGG